jgi:hypothetical protein
MDRLARGFSRGLVESNVHRLYPSRGSSRARARAKESERASAEQSKAGQQTGRASAAIAGRAARGSRAAQLVGTTYRRAAGRFAGAQTADVTGEAQQDQHTRSGQAVYRDRDMLEGLW